MEKTYRKRINIIAPILLFSLIILIGFIGYFTPINIAYADSNDDIDYVIDPVPADSVMISVPDDQTTLFPGESIRIGVILTPYYCNVQTVTYEIIMRTEWAEINSDGFLTVKETAPIGEQIGVTADAEGTLSEVYTFTIVKIPVESVTIDAGGQTVIREGGELQLASEVLPLNASYPTITYTLTEGTKYAQIDDNGLIRINDIVNIPNAVIKVQAEADGIKSNELTFSIYVPTNTVRLAVDNDRPKSSSTFGASVTLNTRVDVNASSNNPTFIIVSGQEFIESLEGNVLTVNSAITAVDPVIAIKAVCDGVESEVVELHIYIPIEKIEIKAGITSIHEGGVLQLDLPQIYPANATEKTIEYLIADGDRYASIDKNGRITVSDAVGIGNATISVLARALADGIESNVLNFSVYVPVKSLSLSSDKNVLASYATSGESTTLRLSFNKDASEKSADYRIETGTEFVESLDGDTLKIRANIRDVNAAIVLCAQKEGVTSNRLTIAVHVPVENLSFTFAGGDLNNASLERGKSYAIVPRYNNDNIASTKGWRVLSHTSNLEVSAESNTVRLMPNSKYGESGSFTYRALDNGRTYSCRILVKQFDASNFTYQFTQDSNGSQINSGNPQLMAGRSMPVKLYCNDLPLTEYGFTPQLSTKTSNADYVLGASDVTIAVAEGQKGRNNFIELSLTIQDGSISYAVTIQRIQIIKLLSGDWGIRQIYWLNRRF